MRSFGISHFRRLQLLVPQLLVLLLVMMAVSPFGGGGGGNNNILKVVMTTVEAARPDDGTPDGELLSICMKTERDSRPIRKHYEEKEDDEARRRRLEKVEVVDAGRVLKLIEGHDADVNARDERSGVTALMAATLEGRTTIVRLLLGKGADFSIADKDGYTPVHGAAFRGRVDILRILHEEYGVDVKDDRLEDGYMPIHRACWGGDQRHTETVRYLLEEAGVDPDVGGGPRRKPCHEMTPNVPTMQLLHDFKTKRQEEL